MPLSLLLYPFLCPSRNYPCETPRCWFMATSRLSTSPSLPAWKPGSWQLVIYHGIQKKAKAILQMWAFMVAHIRNIWDFKWFFLQQPGKARACVEFVDAGICWFSVCCEWQAGWAAPGDLHFHGSRPHRATSAGRQLKVFDVSDPDAEGWNMTPLWWFHVISIFLFVNWDDLLHRVQAWVQLQKWNFWLLQMHYTVQFWVELSWMDNSKDILGGSIIRVLQNQILGKMYHDSSRRQTLKRWHDTMNLGCLVPQKHAIMKRNWNDSWAVSKISSAKLHNLAMRK